MVIPVIVALALVQPVPGAQSKKSSWVALIKTEGEVPVTWREALQKAAEESKAQTWVPPPAVTLDEAQLALGCLSFSASCAAQIAEMTGATHALIIDVTAHGAAGKIALELVKANGKPERDRVTADLLDLSADGLSWAQDVVRGYVKNKVPALLYVQTSVQADVHIDGVLAGTSSPTAPLRVKVEPGEHKVNLVGDGAPLVITVSAKPGQVLRETHALAPEVVPVGPETKPPHTHETVPSTVAAKRTPTDAPESSAVMGWSLAGAGSVVAAVAGTVHSVALYDLYFKRVPCASDPGGCVPNEPVMFGFYQRPQRNRFYGDPSRGIAGDATVWLAASGATLGLGAIVAAAGVFVAVTEAVQGAE